MSNNGQTPWHNRWTEPLGKPTLANACFRPISDIWSAELAAPNLPFVSDTGTP